MPALSEQQARLANLGLVTLTVLAIAGFLLTRNLEFGHDDAFITNAYADNLARGHGLVFNAGGERVWGYTSPAHTLLLGLAGILGLPIHRAGIFFSLLLVIPICDLVYRILFAVSRRSAFAALGSLLFLTSGPLYCFLGLETNLLILLQLGFVWLVLTHRYELAALVAALACLTRPDALLLVAAVAATRRGLRTGRCIALFGAFGAAWLGFTLVYYQALLPQPFYAKSGMTPFLDYLRAGLGRFLTTGVPLLAEFAPGFRPAEPLLPSWPTALLKTGLGLAVLRERPEHRSLLGVALLAYPALALLAYATLGPPPEHFWHLYPAYLHFSLAPWVGAAALLRRDPAATPVGYRRPPGRAWFAARAAAALLALAGLAVNAGRTLDLLREQEIARWRGARLRAYSRIASWISDQAPSGARILVAEPGTIRYFVKRQDVTVVDLEGLVWKGDPLRGCADRCYLLVPGRRQGAQKLLETAFVPATYFPNLDGYSDFTLMERSAAEVAAGDGPLSPTRPRGWPIARPARLAGTASAAVTSRQNRCLLRM